jgi:uncharacterized protein YyaL (SSP411 family)
MKLLYLTILTGCLVLFSAFGKFQPSPTAPSISTLKWYTWDEAVALQKTAPKKMMIDMYTDWCGWCKRMDATTFSDPTIVAYLQENFYPVKFDAEQKGTIQFNQYTFKYLAPEGGQGRGVHELAYSLLEGKLGYPSIVYLTPNFERILISPGYKDTTGMMLELKFVQEEVFKSKSFEDYKAGK